ncbi:MAG: class I SAM-dependent methyltransferase, partial [Acidimicrobiia bacterium]|nr:class I SAM-dependent methyltransferase [Acidimicrobiia bacterium]
MINPPELVEVLAESRRRGFLGPGPLEAHVHSAQAFAHALPTACIKGDYSLLDLGSGGGVPALPLLVWFEDLCATLVDARSKRTRFLDEAASQLGLDARTSIVTARIEDVLEDHQGCRVVTARSFGPPSATIEIASSLLIHGGLALISEPPGGRLWAADGLASIGVRQRSNVGDSIAVFEKVGSSPAR